MTSTKYSDRSIPKISLHDFESRVDDITTELVAAADSDGFFALVDHGISVEEIEQQFNAAEPTNKNAEWEKAAQIRPWTGKTDQKESYQIQFGKAMDGMWISEETIPGLKNQSLNFMHKVQKVSEKLMLCFARGLDFPDDYFIKYHDVSRDNVQTVLRVLHYFAVDSSIPTPEGYYRAGPHTDWDFLTLLFQRPGQSGLEICPGREVFTEFGLGDTWTKVDPKAGEIVCNIGDLLMSWSDDRFKSTLHRVKTPTDPAVDYFGPRYSMTYFNQPNTDCQIQGPLKKYPMIHGWQFTETAMKKNFAALEAKKATIKKVEGTKDGPVAAAS